jgi:hypothetical protein
MEHADSGKRRSGTVSPISKLADAAILKISELVVIRHLPIDFDNI